MKPPLYVDLDGTLVRIDTMQQAWLIMARDHPIGALRALIRLFKGRQAAKDLIAQTVTLDPASLPYREPVIEYIKQAKTQGRRVVLATGSHRKYADAVARYLGIFDAVYATDPQTNLIGLNKLESIRTDCQEQAFEYLGDSGQDIVIFEASTIAGLVGGRRFQPLKNAHVQVHRLAHLHNNTFRDVLRLIRPHQWVKNLLIGLPLLASHRLGDTQALGITLVTFVVFSGVASGNYILNDLLDAESDRKHPQKKHRPIACGAVTVPTAVLWMTLLLLGGLIGSLLVSAELLLLMLGYLVLANLYSFQLKRRLLLDVLALAGMYTVRPLAGGIATGIIPSTWLLAFCMFFFACLAFAKRYTELRHMLEPGKNLPGRAYEQADLDILRVVGPVNGYLAVMVVALYISSPAVTALYTRPQVLWLICPVLAYWITRLWFFAHRGKLDHDPVVFALKDWKTWLAAGVCMVVGIFASI